SVGGGDVAVELRQRDARLSDEQPRHHEVAGGQQEPGGVLAHLVDVAGVTTVAGRIGGGGEADHGGQHALHVAERGGQQFSLDLEPAAAGLFGDGVLDLLGQPADRLAAV